MLPFIWPLIAQGAGIVAKSFMAPKASDYKPNTDYIQRYVSMLRGRRSDREVYQSIIRPQVRAIGQQQGQALRTNRQIFARQGLSGSGAEAQNAQNIINTATGKLQGVNEQATAQQLIYNRNVEDRIQQANLDIGRIQEEGKRQYRIAKNQYQAGLIGDIANLAGNAAMGIGQQYELAKNTFETAKATGLTDANSVGEFRKSMNAAGYTNAQAYTQSLQRKQGIENTDAIIATVFPGVAKIINKNKALQNISGEQKFTVAKTLQATANKEIPQEYASYLIKAAGGAGSQTLMPFLESGIKSGKLTPSQLNSMANHILSVKSAELKLANKAPGTITGAKPAEVAKGERLVTRAMTDLNFAMPTIKGKLNLSSKAQKAYNELMGEGGLMTNLGLTSDPVAFGKIQRNIRTLTQEANVNYDPTGGEVTFGSLGVKFSLQELGLDQASSKKKDYVIQKARDYLYKSTIDNIQKGFDAAKVVGGLDGQTLIDKYLKP